MIRNLVRDFGGFGGLGDEGGRGWFGLGIFCGEFLRLFGWFWIGHCLRKICGGC